MRAAGQENRAQAHGANHQVPWPAPHAPVAEVGRAAESPNRNSTADPAPPSLRWPWRPVLAFLFPAFLLSCFAAFSSGCSTPAYARPTTRLTVDDFDAMASHMAQSFSKKLADRGPASEPWIVSMQKVTNLSSDVIPEREQWSVMAQLRGSQPIQTLWTTKNIRFVMPAERVTAMREDEDNVEFRDDAFAADRAPTHVMTGTFRSVTRGEPEGKVRTDFYSMEFEILDLRTNLPVWTDAFEFKRAAKGKLWD